MTWPDVRGYLEAHCNPTPHPLPATTVRYAHLLWCLAEGLAVKSVLEIGIGPKSMSGCIFAQSMGSRGGGRLVSVDIDPTLPAAEYEDFAVKNRVVWSHLYGDSLTLVDSLPAGFSCDLLYIDGDHDEAHAYGDTIGYLKYLRPGGLLVIDDYPMCQGVVAAKRRLEAEGFTFVHVPHEPPAGNGRLLWQKPE